IKAAKARAFALARRPVGKAAHKSIDGKVQAGNTCLALPLPRSGWKIHSEATHNPRPAKTASRRPSAAVVRTLPFSVTVSSTVPLRNDQVARPFDGQNHRSQPDDLPAQPALTAPPLSRNRGVCR